MSVSSRLGGKVALVSGGARGMGAAHVRKLAQHGAKVVFGDILTELGSKHEAELRAQGLDVRFVKLDVTRAEDWEAAVAACKDWGGVDVLVNNAGILEMRDAVELDEQGWQRTMDVNAKGVWLGMKHCVPNMKEKGKGSIINVSSIYGLIGAEGYLAYTASKGAVTLMTKSACETYGPLGIRTNSIHPGAIDTDMLAEEVRLLPPGGLQRFIDSTPLRRLAAPEEVSNCVLFLASDESSYVSGAELTVDGGLLAAR
ncbi:short-chain dehydrogenase/reductase SDR [Hyaloraphidium curvatum]|nr:short-chain dehydrogenase/reductase SDR [Hyaloraphidium curvatum]